MWEFEDEKGNVKLGSEKMGKKAGWPVGGRDTGPAKVGAAAC